MAINKAILHILDFNSGMCILSQRELDFTNDTISPYIEKHLERIQLDANQKLGTFRPESTFLECLKQFLAMRISFVELSTFIGDMLYKQISSSDKLDSTDLLIADFTNNDIRYVALLLLTSKTAYTHQVLNDDGLIYNGIIKHSAILPNVMQKIDSYAIVRCDNFEIGFIDKKRMIDGKDVYLLPEILLQCSGTISSKDAIKAVSQIATKIAENHEANTAIVLSKTKNYLVENSELSTTFSPIELGQDVFADSEEMQKEFEAKIHEAQLPKDVKVERALAVRTGKNHKIKTDTGIEIIFPTEYFKNHDYIEFINNPDGTISIELKNIGKILNK